jgi:hypothetical protein
VIWGKIGLTIEIQDFDSAGSKSEEGGCGDAVVVEGTSSPCTTWHTYNFLHKVPVEEEDHTKTRLPGMSVALGTGSESRTCVLGLVACHCQVGSPDKV